MTGGSLSLSSARGVGQDVINISPQITFFKKVYKRHTNFGIESVLQSDTSPDFGGSTEYKILKTGSLITDMHIEFTLPPARGTGGINTKGGGNGVSIRNHPNADSGIVQKFANYAYWVNTVGFAIINQIQLKFGSTILDKHTGLWYDVWNELSDPNKKEWSLVGKYTNREDENWTNTDENFHRYFVPLKFYFNRNPGLALPIMLLNDNDLRVTIALQPLNTLLNFDILSEGSIHGTTSISKKPIIDFKFFVDYVFLEPDEESRIQNSLPSEYLVETLDIKDNLTASDVSSLVFENPTKEFIWVFRDKKRIRAGDVSTDLKPLENVKTTDYPNDIFNYSAYQKNTSLKMGTYDPFDSLTIKINNKERFDDTKAPFFRTIQPYKYHSNIPGSIDRNHKKVYIYVYSFALSPEEYQPTGSYNFSLGDDKINFEFTGGDDRYDLTIFSTRYEYLVFNQGRVSISRVPIQNTLQSISTTSQKSGTSGKKTMSQQIAETNDTAVQNEIKRRYATEVPYLAEQRLGKKAWSGLQGDFFQKQKSDDMGKKYETKKKDIF